MATEIFKEYYSRLAKEGFLKALLWGLLVGFSVLLFTALVCWIAAFNGLWIMLSLFVVSAVTTTLLLYYKKFRPTTKSIAQRIDKLGLEERLITMTELENDPSFIALKQREDALSSLGKVNTSLLKFAISVPLIASVVVVGLFGAGMTTVSALSAAGVIKSGKDVINEITKDPVFYEIVYEVEGEGEVLDATEQIVEEGFDAEPVYAEAADGWYFVEWSDGVKDPYRQDVSVSEDMSVTAIFEEQEEGDDDGESGEGDEADKDSGEPEEGDNDQQQDQPSNEPKPGVGGQYVPSNQVYDGESFYGGFYDDAHNSALEELGGSGVSGGKQDFIKDYWDIIQKNNNNEE